MRTAPWIFALLFIFWIALACGCGNGDDDANDQAGVTYGACCEEGQCSVKTYEDCAGAWQGPNTDCSPNPCETSDDDSSIDDDAVDDDTIDDDASNDDVDLFQKMINDSLERPWTSANPLSDGVLLTSYDGFFSTFMKVDDNADILWTKRFDQSASVALNNSIFIPGDGDISYHIGADAAKI